MNIIRKLVAVSVVAAAALGAGLAQARPDVQWSVQIAGPIGVAISSPPYVTYVRPVAVPIYVQPGYGYGHGHGYGDRDRDGIPNRYDRVYNPRWDRDGDGVPNRYDRRDDRRGGRDDRRDDSHGHRHGGR